MTEPNYCPNCGAPFSGEFSAVAISNPENNSCGYDCYCFACKWSGDIWPDDEAEGRQNDQRPD